MFGPPKKLSPARQAARIIVWVAFGVVLTLRALFPPEHRSRVEIARREFGQQRQFRRPPTPVYPPAAEIPSDLWRIHIEIAPADVEKLRGYYWNRWRGAPQERPEVPATVREGGVVYTNVALHLKGSAGSFRPFDDKPALTLNFSKHASGQHFHGFSKISLNNSVQDPSYLSEAIARELFNAAGVPTPLATHATVLIDGRDLGLYVLIEGFGKTFLKRHFKNVKGNLYDGGFCQEITTNLDTNSGDSPRDHSDLQRLLDAASESDVTNRWQRLKAILDIDRFMNFIAMEVITCHWDGYGMNRNNYRVFHDLEKDRLVFMPHGMDQMFGWGGWGRNNISPTSPIDPPTRGMVARAATSTVQGYRLYYERIAALRTNVFSVEKWTNRVREISAKIRPTLAAYSQDMAARHDADMAYLCQRMAERAQSISEQLAVPKEPIPFDSEGVARLSGWKRRVGFQQPRFQQRGFRPAGASPFEKEEIDGTTALHIVAGPSSGSWITRVFLGNGRYRFEGRVRTSNVGSTGGVCLRVLDGPINPPRTSEDAWTTIGCDFTIQEPLTEVDLICELRAAKGEVWIDEKSLRLIRE